MNERLRAEDLHFFCTRREMLVTRDLMDCSGCPLKNFPTPCDQYHKQKAFNANAKLSYDPIITEPTTKMDVTE